MKLIERIHEGCVFGRRVRCLAGHMAAVLPEGAHVLDVGCGNGAVAKHIMELRPDLSIRGIDVLVRSHTYIPVEHFDGSVLPYGNASFDAVMFVDVLHHTVDPLALLKEAARVTRRAIVIKDHTADGTFSRPILRFMDYVGNAHHGVALPYTYWSTQRWQEACKQLSLKVDVWKQDVRLYPWIVDWLFGHGLHVVTRLEPMCNSL